QRDQLSDLAPAACRVGTWGEPPPQTGQTQSLSLSLRARDSGSRAFRVWACSRRTVFSVHASDTQPVGCSFDHSVTRDTAYAGEEFLDPFPNGIDAGPGFDVFRRCAHQLHPA